MSRRSAPERLDVARRSATVERLVSAGMLRDRAAAAVAAYVVRTAQDGRLRFGRWNCGLARSMRLCEPSAKATQQGDPVAHVALGEAGGKFQ